MSHLNISARLVLAIAGGLLCNVSLASDCDARPVEGNSDRFAVHRADDSYAGYVRLTSRGDWIAWVHNQGEQNFKFATREDAVNRVCAVSSTPR